MTDFTLEPIGVIRSELVNLEDAPRQGDEGAPAAWLDVNAAVAEALDGIKVGDALIVITWFHKADRTTLKTRPRNELTNPMTGVFATRSPDRPNPLGLHRVTVLEIAGHSLKIAPIE